MGLVRGELAGLPLRVGARRAADSYEHRDGGVEQRGPEGRRGKRRHRRAARSGDLPPGLERQGHAA
jgi:hypothetical protein